MEHMEALPAQKGMQQMNRKDEAAILFKGG